MPSENKAFPPEVREAINSYVYRLIDPRNGETFYVGKGKDDRVFAHASDELKLDQTEDEASEKLRRIREIRNAGFEVQHVIHRHGLDSITAFEVEAALMDAYPGLANIAGGQGSADRGAAHAQELIERYAAEPADIVDRVVEVLVPRTAVEKELYDATRYAWRVSLPRAQKAEYVLAVRNGIVLEVYQDLRWLPATFENFGKLHDEAMTGNRFGFEGRVAGEPTRSRYVRKRVPERKRGSANPIRYYNVT